MAEKSDNSNKVVCRSRKAINIVSETLCNSLRISLQKDGERTPEERSRYITKFKEVLEKVSEQNIVVTGETSDKAAANTTPEYEPVDNQKEEHISEELLPRRDDCVVKIARQRKRLPHVCVNHFTDFSNHQAAYMSKVKPRAQQEDINSITSDAKDVTSFINCQQLHQPCADLSRLTKMASRELHRAGHVTKAVEIEVSNRTSQTAQVMHGHSPLVESSYSSSVCGVCHSKRRLDSSAFADNPTSSKVTRFSGLLARDFPVLPLST